MMEEVLQVEKEKVKNPLMSEQTLISTTHLHGVEQ
jgi:hypothetical protein